MLPADPKPANTVSADDPRATARIVIVDDEPINIKVARRHLQNVGYQHFITTSDATEAMGLIERQRPDVVILDVMMPGITGLEILRAIRADPHLLHIPVLILTASTDAETRLKALESGATDFLAKPVDPNELLPRIRNALIVKAHHDYLARHSVELEQQVYERTIELERSRLQVVLCLARAGEFRDDATGRHVLRVGRYVTILARDLGYSNKDADMMGIAAQLHDVGKIGLPDEILLKRGPLTPEEFAVVKRHCEIGSRIMQPVHGDELKLCNDLPVPAELIAFIGRDDHPLLAMAMRIALSHHERFDGAGYPKQLAGEAIPREGRITSVADVFDALTSRRPYKDSMDPIAAVALMEKGRGTQFDPSVLDALCRRLDDFLAVRREAADRSVDQAA